MDKFGKARLEERIVKKVSKSILYKLDAYDRMRQRFWESRDKIKMEYDIPTSNKDIDKGVEYAFESFYYYCLDKWEKGELN